jgi:high affinity Mn2+ porin
VDLYFDPEIAGGRGDSGVYGLGAPPNGDITRVGNPTPTPYVARVYLQRYFALGCETEKVESAPNQLAGDIPVSRITLAVGKMAASDWFDQNRYAHDPRTQFMNWALMYNPAWDYPADVRGYSWGGVVEWNERNFALRYGIFAEPDVANGAEYDDNLSQAHGQSLELELRYKLCDRPGKARGMVYVNNADMGNYREALILSPVNPDVTQTRSYSVKYGFCLSLEQEFTDLLGGFMRLGWSDGQTETWAYTECDQTLSLGVTLKGKRWGRPQDEVGVGVALDGLSPDHTAYLAAGGLGFELGDGRLAYGPESVLEAYYRMELSKSLAVSPDLQLIQNPGYNTDRGPLFIAAVRVHAEF